MARSTRMRSHPTASIGVNETSSNSLPNTRSQRVLPEVNTVHAFSSSGLETSGWPNRGYGQIGTAIPGTPYLYRAPRASQNDLGGGSNRRRRTRKRKHPTQSIGV